MILTRLNLLHMNRFLTTPLPSVSYNHHKKSRKAITQMIVWEKNQPYFISDDKKGDCILLQFVLEYIDDIDIAGERFFVFLQKDESGWKAQIDRNLSYGIVHKDLLHELIAEINYTLETKGSFDMAEYVTANKRSGAYFSFKVCWIEKYRPTPPGISRLVH